MITTSKKPGPQYLRKLMVLPVTIIVIALCAFTYKERQQTNNKLSLENNSSFADTTVDPKNTVKEILADGPVYLNATNFIVHGNPSEANGLSDCIYIINGKEVSKNDIFNKMIEAQNVIAYQPNDKTAIDLYGPKAKNGVLVFEKATITDAKQDTVSPRATDQVIFDKVKIEPAFPGGSGSDEWRQYLQRNLDASVPVKNKAPDNTYTVVIQFIVDQQGIVSDVKALTNHGYGMEEEAMRVIKKGPRWVPAVQDGKVVKAYKKQPITFVVDKGEKVSNSSGNDLTEVVVTGYPSTKSSFKSYSEFTSNKSFDNHLLIINNKVMGKFRENGKNLDMNNIKSFTVLDENTAMKKYGTAGKFGAIEALTKNNTAPYDSKNDVEVVGYSSASKTFTKTETPPSFPGGDSAWKKYLIRNINASTPVDKGAPAGIYKVIIQFIVHEDGSITDINSLTDHGFGMEEEAMRMIKAGPKWIPAKQNGHTVSAYVQQPVTFAIEDEGSPSITGVNPKSTTLSLIPAISLSELKNASIHTLLQLPEGTEIIGYMFTIDPNGVVKESVDKGSKFNSTTRDLIRSAKVGNTVIFDHIKIMENGAEKRLPARVYKVTN